jgi:hypothetical protein
MIRIGDKHVKQMLKQHWQSNRRKWMKLLELVDERRAI